MLKFKYMTKIKILLQKDDYATFRGGGRYIQLLKEYLNDKVEFIENIKMVQKEDTLLIPFFNFFTYPFLTKKICKKQILVIFDTIPLKYSSQFPPGIKGKVNSFVNLHYLKIYDQVLTISQHSKKDINKYLKVPLEKIKVIYPVLTKVFFEKETDNRFKNLKEPYFLYVGDINWNKNLVDLAQAIKKTKFKCYFVGKAFKENQDLNHPWLKSYKEFRQESTNNDQFVFLGYVKDEELVSLYKNAIANILVSVDEGFGFSYLEAASQYCPSIMLDTNITREITQNTALTSAENNPGNIAKLMEQIYQDKKMRNNLSQLAFERSLFFKPKIFQNEILNI